jgi:hypothetical protein
MEPLLEQCIIYGGAGALLLVHGLVSLRKGRLGFGGRLFRFKPTGSLDAARTPRRFLAAMVAYLLFGAGMLGRGLHALYLHLSGPSTASIFETVIRGG